MEKAYNQSKENEIYNLWENSKAFTPVVDKKQKPFTTIMPPPNANDPLHVGHARFVTIEDILVRYYRMKGYSTLWLPGADHAGIETQFVFEKKLSKEGKSRFDFPRDEFYEMVWNYVQKNREVMENQLKNLGASCDWTRMKFTLDPDIISQVYNTFKHLYDDGLIYRGKRMVNYCPRCGTAYSQLEVDTIERTDTLYFLDYKTITIATTRPETIFADVAIAVHPKDERFSHLIGKTATIPLINREIPIIADSEVLKDFGTGALKITPAHDPLDFEIGQKHSLPIISVIDERGKMLNTPPKYTGLKAERARAEVAQDLKEAGKIKEEKPLLHTIGICYRCKGTIEPTLREQWFLKVEPLVKKSLEALKNKEVVFASKKHEKQARHWYKNLKDWNISRQIVWGMRIPAWRCQKCLEWVITSGETPSNCPHCKNDKLVQDTDTFDTWFSSAQWPFATLKNTQKGDFEYFYPTSVMVTAYDILPFWVIRMIMLGLYATEKVPFKSVLLYGLVRDKEGQKISKSKGNVIDPIQMIDTYGADALRMGLVWGGLIENDITLSEDKIRGQRNFANKVWNIARFILDNPDITLSPSVKRPRVTNESDREILEKLTSVTKKMNKLIPSYRLNEAAESIYDFIWHDFADKYIESTKERKQEASPTLHYVLSQSLKLLHPFMPFVTEKIWQQGKDYFDSPLLLTSKYPS